MHFCCMYLNFKAIVCPPKCTYIFSIKKKNNNNNKVVAILIKCDICK